VIRRLLDDRGSAVVEFALVAPLLLLVALAVVQTALAMHVRSVMTAAAAEGARSAALAGSHLALGEQRTRQLLAGNLAEGVVEEVVAARRLERAGPVVEVRVTARVPLLGLFGPTGMQVTGRALDESG
jgi:hypothetical protein